MIGRHHYEVGQVVNLMIEADDLDQAIEHINRYGSQHTDAIVTENYTRARRFLRKA